MTEREFEQRLRAFYRTEAGGPVPSRSLGRRLDDPG